MKNENDQKPDKNRSEAEAENIRRQIEDNEPNYHSDPAGNSLADDSPDTPNGLFGDHEDDFDIG